MKLGVKHRSAHLVVLNLIAAEGGNLFNHKWDSIAQSLSLSSSHHPDITEILLKRK